MALGLTFAFDAEKETPQDVARRRAIAEAIMGRSMSPKNVGEGFGAIANGIVANVQNRRAQAGEQAGQAGANDIFGRIMSGLTGQPYSGQQSSFEQNATPLDPASSRVASAHSASASPGSFSGSQQEFVDMLMPAAMEASQRTGIDPRIIVAQAAQETGWGRSAPGNNFFGIKSHGKGGGQTFNTHEYVDGKRVNISDSFRQFGSPEESVAGYADFILENPRYRKLMGAQGLDAQLEALQASGYATDPNYSRSVGSIARGIEIPDAQQALENLAVGEATTLPSMDVPVQDPQMAMASPQMPMPQQQMGMQPPQIPQQAQQPVQMAQAGGLDLQTLMEAAANPFLNEGQRAVVNSLLQQQLQQQDPMRQLDMDYKRAQTEKLQRELSGDFVGDPTVQSSTILDDGTSVLVMRDGSRRVIGPAGEEVSGQAAADAIRSARDYTVENQQAIYGGRRAGTLGADIELGGDAAAAVKVGEASVKAGMDSWTDYGKLQSSLSNIDEAIRALDDGAKSGIVYNMLPNVTDASASLENAMNRMGLDVIGSVTFGALSEGEMRLAMETAVPRNLQPAELRNWLVRKRDAQQKAAEMLANAAQFLTVPGNTINDWIARNRAEKGSAPTGSGGQGTGQRLRFNPETGELE